MKISILQKALQNYAASADCPDNERQEVFKALNTCAATIERYHNRDIWHDEATLITDESLDEVLRQLSYDIYDKRAKIHGHNFPFEYYAHDCHKDMYLERFTNEQLQIGYEIISELWLDNNSENNQIDTSSEVPTC